MIRRIYNGSIHNLLNSLVPDSHAIRNRTHLLLPILHSQFKFVAVTDQFGGVHGFDG